jgi:rRNA maturation protein Rpf1
MDLCDSALDQGATRILLVGAFHGNPGRIGFLEFNGETWQFIPPTIIIKAVQLLRELSPPKKRRPTQLFVLADTPHDQNNAELLAQAFEVPWVQRDALHDLPKGSVLLQVRLRHPKTIAFLTPDEKQPLGPKLVIKYFLTRPMGDQKRW